MDFIIIVLLIFLSYSPKITLSFLLFLYDINYFIFFCVCNLSYFYSIKKEAYTNDDFIFQNEQGSLICKNHVCIFDNDLGFQYSLEKNSDIPYLIEKSDTYKIICVHDKKLKFSN